MFWRFETEKGHTPQRSEYYSCDFKRGWGEIDGTVFTNRAQHMKYFIIKRLFQMRRSQCLCHCLCDTNIRC